MSSELVALEPITVFPSELKVLLYMMATSALAVTGAVDVNWVIALTIRVWMPVAPSTTSPLAVNSALAVMGAVGAKVVTALTVRLWLPLAPNTTLP